MSLYQLSSCQPHSVRVGRSIYAGNSAATDGQGKTAHFSNGHWLFCDLLKLQFGCMCDMSTCLLDTRRAFMHQCPSCNMLHTMCVMQCDWLRLLHHTARSSFNAAPANAMVISVHSSCLNVRFQGCHSCIGLFVCSLVHSLIFQLVVPWN